MRNAESILAIIQERGKKGLPLERVYRLLYTPEFYLMAYGKLYGNKGAMTPGVNGETVDEMSTAKIKAIIELIRYERYEWTPTRRVYIPKANGKKRPLGIPSWSDKLLQEVMRTILEAYYEPQFAGNSHGFRPEKGTHTALREIRTEWTGTAWFIEGDIKGCFDNINHATLLEILRRNIHDERFILLISKMLRAGYMEQWEYHKTYSGSPQGGVVSPLLANIYMNELDQFVNCQLTPQWTRGERRKINPKYATMRMRMQRLRNKGKKEEAMRVRKELTKLPSVDTRDQGYRRLRYVRYADDFLIGFAGPKEEAEKIKEEIRMYLQEHLKLELSGEKTLVTHARSETARFLGYEIHVIQADDQKGRDKRVRLNGRRNHNGTIGLRVPEDVVQKKCQKYTRGGKPAHRPELRNNSDFANVQQYQAEYRGLVNYYSMAYNIHRLSYLRWIMERSLTMTLALVHKTSVKGIYRKYRTKATVNGRPYMVLRATVARKGKEPLTATGGGIPLTYKPAEEIKDEIPQFFHLWNRTELVHRLLANECEYCGSHDHIEVHHIKALKDLKRKGREVPKWVQLMAAKKRKTMVLCRTCHQDVTYGRPLRNQMSGRGFMQRVTDHAPGA